MPHMHSQCEDFKVAQNLPGQILAQAALHSLIFLYHSL